MNRKDFLLKSTGSLAALSVAGMLRSNAQTEPSNDEKYWVFAHDQEIKQNGSNYTLSHHFKISKEASSCGDFMEVELTVRKGPSGSTSNLKIGHYTSKLEKCKAMDGKVTRLRMCPYEWIKGDGLLDEGIFGFFTDNKSYIDLHFDETADKSVYIEVLKKKKKEFVTRVDEYVPPVADFDFDDTDCFLTTVCVQHKGLSDDCRELSVLRNFRDSFVAEGRDGQELIEAYYGMGPQIVASILGNPNKDQILDDMYESLVEPTIGLIESGKLAEAKDYYVAYTLAVKDSVSLKGK